MALRLDFENFCFFGCVEVSYIVHRISLVLVASLGLVKLMLLGHPRILKCKTQVAGCLIFRKQYNVSTLS